MLDHLVKWTAPSPLWTETANTPDIAVRRTFSQPAILRFATDAFMDQFLAVLEKDPAQFGGLVAQPETWRGPTPPPQAISLLEPVAPTSSFARKLNRLRLATQRLQRGSASGASANNGGTGAAPRQRTLKLYQPAHQRYYLVGACLVCGLTGLPDRTLDSGHQERAFFVMRRFLPRQGSSLTSAECSLETCDEYAFVTTPRGSGWQRLSDVGAQLIPGEEQLPLFAVSFTEDDSRRRRLFAGLIPVGKREAYMAAPKSAATAPGTPGVAAPLPKTARKILFRSQVVEPWKSVIQQAYAVRKTLKESAPRPTIDQRDALLRSAHAHLQTLSWYILLDLAGYLQQYVHHVWLAVNDPRKRNALSNIAQQNLFDALNTTLLPQGVIDELLRPTKDAQGHAVNLYTAASFPASLRGALTDSRDATWQDKLEKVTGSYDRLKADPNQPDKPDPAWPTFLFPLADVYFPAPLDPIDGAFAPDR